MFDGYTKFRLTYQEIHFPRHFFLVSMFNSLDLEDDFRKLKLLIPFNMCRLPQGNQFQINQP